MSQGGRFFANGGGGVGPVFSLTGNIGGIVYATGAGNIDVIGAAGITVTGNPGLNTLTITGGGTSINQIDADVGSALPVAGIINLNGVHNINTAAAGNIVQIRGNNTISLGDIADVSLTPALVIDSGDIEFTDPNDCQDPATLQQIKFPGNGPSNIISFFLNNVFIGGGAGNTTMTPGVAIFQIAIGSFALHSCTLGSFNIAIGNGALEDITVGNTNQCLGYGAGGSIKDGNSNVGMGANSLSFLVSGNYNSAYGDDSGIDFVGSESSNLVLASRGQPGDNNTIRIGTSGSLDQEQNRCFIAGIENVDLNTTEVVTIDADQLGSATLTAGAGISITPGAGILTIAATGGGVTSITGDTGAAQTGALTLTGGATGAAFGGAAGTITMTFAGITANGGVVSLGTDVASNAINIGTGAAARTITIGNTTGATGLALKTGTNDFSLASATGTIISALDTGEITYPLQSAFLAYLATSDNNVTGNGGSYTLGSGNALTEDFDQNNDLASNGIFTAPVTGHYRFTYSILLLQMTGATNADITLLTSNYIIRSTQISPTVVNTGGSWGFQVSFFVNMDAADTAAATFNLTGIAGNTADVYGAAGDRRSWFSGNLVC